MNNQIQSPFLNANRANANRSVTANANRAANDVASIILQNKQLFKIPSLYDFIKVPQIPDIQFKYIIIAMLRIFSTPEGLALLKASLNVIDPALKIFTEKMGESVNKNRDKFESIVKDMTIPIASAVRDAMGTIPWFGEALALYLVVKNIITSVVNGANLFSSTVDIAFTIPLKQIFEEVHKSLKNASELKNDINLVNDDLKNILTLFNKINDETQKIQTMVETGTDMNSLLTNKVNAAANAATNKVASATNKINAAANAATNKVAATANKVASAANTVANAAAAATAIKIGGSSSSSNKLIIKKSIRRINKWVRKFKGTIKNNNNKRI